MSIIRSTLKIFNTIEKARAYAKKMNEKAKAFKYIVIDSGVNAKLVIKRRKR
jgi:hypothetical protein